MAAIIVLGLFLLFVIGMLVWGVWWVMKDDEIDKEDLCEEDWVR